MTELGDGWHRWALGAEVRVDADDGRTFEGPDGRTTMPPAVRLTAMFGERDGLPEQVEVVWETEFPDSTLLIMLVEACGSLARRRWQDVSPRDITG